MPQRKYIVDEDTLNDLETKGGVAEAIRELTALLTNRTQDLPHRFRCPASFAEYMADWGVNQSTYFQVPIPSNNSATYMTMQMTTRPSQRILELIFQGTDGMRLFTLELEY